MKKLYGVYFSIFLVLLVVFLYEINRPQPVDWMPHLKSNSKSPFGQKILIDHLEDLYDTVNVTSADLYSTVMKLEEAEPVIYPLEATERTRYTRLARKEQMRVDSVISGYFNTHFYEKDSTEEEAGQGEYEEHGEYQDAASEIEDQQAQAPLDEVLLERLAVQEKDKKSSYVITNSYFSVDEKDFFSLLTYVAEGGSVLISTEKFSKELALNFQLQQEAGYLPDSNSLNFDSLKAQTHELTVNQYYKDLFPKGKYYVSREITTSYFKLDKDCVADTILVNKRGFPVLIGYACGRGKIYLSSLPLLFTNIEVLHGNRALLTAMLNLVWSKKVYWDDYYKTHHRGFSSYYGEYQKGDSYVRTNRYGQKSRRLGSREHPSGDSDPYESESDDYDPYGEDKDDDRSILSFITDNDSLRWAWYTLLCTLALYMLSSARRRQKLIPLIHKLQNTTVEFVQMIARLYYLKKDHRDIALKKINYFQEYLRSRYYHKDLSVTESNIDSLARRSQKSPEQIKRLFELIYEVQSSGSISSVKLHVLSQRINEFKSST